METGIPELLYQFESGADEQKKISVVYRLKRYTSDPAVLECMCAAAVETESYRLREALLETLKSEFEKSTRRFVDYATRSSNSRHRCWALVNLSLMGCRTAKEAILTSLRDREYSIRMAAAFNCGLYDDVDVLEALDDVFAGSTGGEDFPGR